MKNLKFGHVTTEDSWFSLGQLSIDKNYFSIENGISQSGF